MRSICSALFVLLLLVACDVGGPTLSVSSPLGDQLVEVVPGSQGVGKPPGAIEVRYVLGQRATIRATLEGPVAATLLEEEQNSGSHLLRFNGVIEDDIAHGEGQVRRVVPDGEYAIVLAAGGAEERVKFNVAGADTTPPSIENVLLRPSTISPNSDAVDDVGEVTFRTSETATLSVDLESAVGNVTRLFAPTEQSAGEQSLVVNGHSPAGEVLADGTYTVTVRAQDSAGNRVEAYKPLVIEAGGAPRIEVVRVEIGPEQIILGNSVTVSITVRNAGNVPLRTQGPDPGFTYTTNDSYSSIEGSALTDRAGLWRVGVDWDGNSGGGGAYRYPFRWGFGKTLMPGEEVITGGKIVILKQERKMWFYAGILQEGIQIVRDRLGRTAIDVDF